MPATKGAVPRSHVLTLSTLALAVFAACSDKSPAPTQPPDSTDCVYFTITAPRTLAVGESARLGAFQESCRPMFLPIDPTAVTWISLDPNVLSLTGTSVFGTSPGVAVVQGTHADRSSQAVVTVGGPQPGPATVTRLRLVGPPMMTVGQRSTFRLIEEMSNATFAEVTDAIQWRSSSPAVVAILGETANTIEIHAWQSGTATITATTSRGRITSDVRVAAR